jgi:hypothetical protein
MEHDSMAAPPSLVGDRSPRVLLAGYLLGVAATSFASLTYYRLFSPIGALLVAAVLIVGAIWSRTCADLARGALAAVLFGTVAIMSFLVAVNIG